MTNHFRSSFLPRRLSTNSSRKHIVLYRELADLDRVS